MENTQDQLQASPEALAEQAAQAQAYFNNMRAMNQIVREMKQIPELPSEVPQDMHPLIRVEMPESGGTYTYMGGYDEPYRGFPFHEFVDKIDILKKILRGGLSSLFHSLKDRNKLSVAMLLLVPWVFKDIAKGTLNASHRLTVRFLFKPIRYSESIRELHRALSVSFHGETDEERRRRLLAAQQQKLMPGTSAGASALMTGYSAAVSQP